MEVSAWTVYWVSRLDGISTAAWVAVGLGGMFLAILSIVCLSEGDDLPGCFLFAWAGWAFVLLVALFTPTTNQAAAMLIIPPLSRSESLQNVGDGLVELAEEWIEELKPSGTTDE